MSYLPIIRIEVEGMKHSIMHALSTHAEEYEAYIQQELEALDVEAIIRAQVSKTAPRMIEAIIDMATEKAIRDALAQAQFSERMGEIVRGAVQGAIEGASRR